MAALARTGHASGEQKMRMLMGLTDPFSVNQAAYYGARDTLDAISFGRPVIFETSPGDTYTESAPFRRRTD